MDTVKQKTSTILLVAGDFDVVEIVQDALTASRFSVSNAYTHQDAIYMLSQELYDVIIVDAIMVDRHTGGSTLNFLAETRQQPIVACISGQGEVPEMPKRANVIITPLTMRDVQASTIQALTPRSTQYLDASTKPTPILASNPNGSGASRRRDTEIRTLLDLSKSMTEVLDLNEVLNRVVNAARDLTDAEEGMILLPEDEELYLRARVGIDTDTARNFRIKTRDTLAGDVFRTGKPSLVNDGGKVKTQYFVNSLLYVPILSHGETIGVLGVNNREKKDVFNFHHQELLTNLASFASIAIENAQAHQDSVERARELEALVAASKVLNSSLSIKETLPNICEQLAIILNVGYAEIYNWDKESNHLDTMARYYKSAWRFGQGPKINLGTHAALNMALQMDRHVRITYKDREYATETAHLRQVGAESMIIIPVHLNREVSGAIRVYHVFMPDSAFSSDAIQRIRQMAIDSLIDLLNSTDRAMSNKLINLAEHVNETLNADWCELSLTMQGSQYLTVLTRIGSALWLNEPQPHIELEQHPDLLYSLQTQEYIVVQESDPDISPIGRLLLDRTQGRSVLGMPLAQRGQTLGIVVFADSENNRVFSTREVDMARAIVGQSATALENAKLVHDLEKSLKDLQDTQERLVITARLSAMGELAAVVAHQINNPMTTIVAETEMLLAYEEVDSVDYKSLEAISRAGKRAANVAKRLLAIARPNDPDMPSDLIDVVDTVKGILSLLQTHIERNNIKVVTDFPEELLPGVMAVKGRLEDVWLNVIMNANDALMNYDRKDKQITISAYHNHHNRAIDVSIEDNGPGIPENIQKQIFSAFFTTKPVGEGTGLGLHVSKEVVENIGGTISVDSVEGAYTRFIVSLPVVDQKTIN